MDFFKRMTTLVLEYLKPIVLFKFIVYVLFKGQCVILEMDKKYELWYVLTIRFLCVNFTRGHFTV